MRRSGMRSRTGLHKNALSMSGGEQQRLCIARALAVRPEILLMDEPASALDPISTAKIEDLIFQLKKEYTIVIVTHNMQQAARVSDYTAFFLQGELVEIGPDRPDFYQSARQAHRGLHHRTFRIGISVTVTKTPEFRNAVTSGMRSAELRELWRLSQNSRGLGANLQHFREELDELNSRLLEMSGLVEDSISRSVNAVIHRDEQAAQTVFKNEDQDQPAGNPDRQHRDPPAGAPAARGGGSALCHHVDQDQQQSGTDGRHRRQYRRVRAFAAEHACR